MSRISKDAILAAYRRRCDDCRTSFNLYLDHVNNYTVEVEDTEKQYKAKASQEQFPDYLCLRCVKCNRKRIKAQNQQTQ